jgi:hypothetical protein
MRRSAVLPRISIVIPSYNQATYLEDAVVSFHAGLRSLLLRSRVPGAWSRLLPYTVPGVARLLRAREDLFTVLSHLR